MGVNTVPRFIETPLSWVTKLSVANPNVSGNTGTVATLLTGSANGSKVDYFYVQAQGPTQANRLRMWLFTSNATPFLLKEIAISAASGPKTTTSMFSTTFTPGAPIVVPSNWTLRCAVHSANVISITAIGGDY